MAVEFVTAAALATHVGLPAADGHATQVAAAVNAYLAGFDWLTTTNPDTGAAAPTEPAKLGALMLGARLHRRRNSVAGLEPLADGGAAYVSRADPDISRLLGLDAWAPPTPA